MRIRLAHQIILVIAIPVIVQVVFLILFTATLRDFFKVQSNERASTQALMLRDRLYLTENHRILLAGMFRATKKPDYAERYFTLEKDVKACFASLATLWQDDPQKSKAVADAARLARANSAFTWEVMRVQQQPRMSDLLGGESGMYFLRMLIDDRNNHPTLVTVTPQLGQRGKVVLDRLFQLEAKHQTNYQKVVDAMESKIKAYLLAGLLASVLISVLTALFFSLSISRRLRTILNNTKLIASRSDKLTHIKGNDEIAELNNSIERTAKKLRQIEEFQAQTIQIIADELQKPLRLISDTFTQLREQGFVTLSDKGMNRLTTSAREISRLRALVNELAFLDESAASGPNLIIESVDLKELAEDAAGIIRDFARSRKIDIVVAAQTQVQARCDRNRVLQVTVNLLSNAIKFSPADSKIEVTVTTEKGFGKISVRDRGPGIDDESKHLIFQKFEQVAASDGVKRSGTGLGLVISKELIEAQHGTMNFASKTGEGSTFWLTLPLLETQVSNVAQVKIPDQNLGDANNSWRPTLLKKVAIVVLLPLFVQLMTIGIMWSELNAVSENIKHYNRASQISTIYAKLTEEIIRSTFYAMLYNAEKDEQSRLGYSNEVKKVMNAYDSIQTMSRGNAVLEKQTTELGNAIKLSLAVQEDIMKSEQNADANQWFGGANGPRTELLVTGIQKPLQESIQHEWSFIEAGALASEDLEQKIELVLLISAMMIGFISIALGLYMMRRLTMRIRTMLRQTLNFSENKVVPPESNENDELAFVNNSFRNSANKLLELERAKGEMVAITSHELRTPLNSLMAMTELIENRVFGELTVDGEKLLESAHYSISDLIVMITDLLDLEKMQSGRILIDPQENETDEIVAAAKTSVEEAARNRDVTVDLILSHASSRIDRQRIVQGLSALMRVLVDHVPAGSKIQVRGEKTSVGLNLIMTVPPIPTVTPDTVPTARERLAISLTRMVAEQHGGQLSITRVPAGRIITISIPDLEAAA